MCCQDGLRKRCWRIVVAYGAWLGSVVDVRTGDWVGVRVRVRVGEQGSPAWRRLRSGVAALPDDEWHEVSQLAVGLRVVGYTKGTGEAVPGRCAGPVGREGVRRGCEARVCGKKAASACTHQRSVCVGGAVGVRGGVVRYAGVMVGVYVPRACSVFSKASMMNAALHSPRRKRPSQPTRERKHSNTVSSA